MAVLYIATPDLCPAKRQVQLLGGAAFDAGDSVNPADLAPIRSLGPGESEELPSDPFLPAL